MSNWILWLGLPSALASISLLMGSIPFGLLVAKVFSIDDLREHGSGNIGATNVSRVLGFWPAGFLTLLLDALKGVVPVVIATNPATMGWLSQLFQVDSFGSPIEWVKLAWMAGFFVVAGHCFSPWLKFKGGKGVATTLGVFLILNPVTAGVGVLAFILTFLRTRVGSLSSLAGVFAGLIYEWIMYPPGVYRFWGLAIVLMVAMRHESNIVALLEDREKIF